MTLYLYFTWWFFRFASVVGYECINDAEELSINLTPVVDDATDLRSLLVGIYTIFSVNPFSRYLL